MTEENVEPEPDPEAASTRKERVSGREWIASRVQSVAAGAESRGMDGAAMLIAITAEAIANCSGRAFLDFVYEVRDVWTKKYAPTETKTVLPFAKRERGSKG